MLRLTALPYLVRAIRQSHAVTIVVYHDIDPVTADKHFEVLKSLYNIISLREYVCARQAGLIDSLPSKAMIVTLDDGHKANYALQGVIKKHGIPITIALCSGIVGTARNFWFKHVHGGSDVQHLKTIEDEERLTILAKSGFNEMHEYNSRHALADHEIEEMKAVVDFQSHTVFHPILPRCSDAKAMEEICVSKKQLEERYELDIYALCYPNGDYTEREIAIAKVAGYECGLTLDDGFNTSHTDLYRLKRTCIPDDAGVSEVIVKASGIWGFFRFASQLW